MVRSRSLCRGSAAREHVVPGPWLCLPALGDPSELAHQGNCWESCRARQRRGLAVKCPNALGVCGHQDAVLAWGARGGVQAGVILLGGSLSEPW